MDLQPILKNDLICLVPLVKGHFEQLYSVASDPLIWKQHPFKDRYKKEEFRVFFDGAATSKSAFMVFENKTNSVIGTSRYYAFDASASKIAIGFTLLSRKYWGGVYNHSMKKLMLDYAFQFVETVVFYVGSSNLRSQKALLKLGAKYVGEEILQHGSQSIIHNIYELKSTNWVLLNP